MRSIASLLVLTFLIVVAQATPAHATYDISGEWLYQNPLYESDLIYFDLTQSGSTVSGSITFDAYCSEPEWPVSGTINVMTGAFSFTATNPDPRDPAPNEPGPPGTCVDWLNFDGTIAGNLASGTWTNYQTWWWEIENYGYGSFVLEFQGQPMRLVASPSELTRGDSATFSIDNLGNGTPHDWTFGGEAGYVERGNSNATTWGGTIVSSGQASVQVDKNGQTYNLAASITVNPRTNMAFTAVSATAASNGASAALTVPNPPVPNGALGTFELEQQYSFTATSVSGGPNAGFKWITNVANTGSGSPAPPTRFRYVIAPALVNTASAFYIAQTGTYSPANDVTPACSAQDAPTQANAGYISGATLLANTRRHEFEAPPSHYHNYTAAQDNTDNNVGVAGEALLGSAEASLQDFIDASEDALDAKVVTITAATEEEPCGVSDVRLNASCTCSGYINY